MHQRVVDRWIEAAEANRVCERAMGEQKLARPITAIPLLLLLMAKLRSRMMLLAAHERRPARPSGAQSAA